MKRWIFQLVSVITIATLMFGCGNMDEVPPEEEEQNIEENDPNLNRDEEDRFNEENNIDRDDFENEGDFDTEVPNEDEGQDNQFEEDNIPDS